MDDSTFATLRRKLARWADDHCETLAKAQPEIPAGFHNRVRRNWWLLLAIAELAGADWADKARKAAAAIEGVRDVSDTEVELLTDTKGIFDAENVEEVSTKSFITKLSEDEERPWATFNKGKPITDRQLARMLRKYGIASEDVHPSDGVHAKGYKRVRFEEAWARYLTPKNASPA
jgi:putative DNA primase/helicase